MLGDFDGAAAMCNCGSKLALIGIVGGEWEALEDILYRVSSRYICRNTDFFSQS